MSWLDKIVPSRTGTKGGGSSRVPEGLWKKCVKCSSVLYRPELERNLDVCPKCDHHFRIGARRRLYVLLDKDGRE
jgi:acetyl-CoA carboxylase carboxyl transferase subunit beta